MNKIIRRLLRRNISKTQLAGFALANIAGLAIIILGIQFYEDAKPLWNDEDSFIRKDYLVINKQVTASNTWGSESSTFSEQEIADLQEQPWVRKTGRFTSADYRLYASVGAAGSDRHMSTYLFFESIPSEFIDVADADWVYKPGDPVVPIIISKDYLSLYNFGFAGTVGMPQLSENTISSVPLTIRVTPENGQPDRTFTGKIVGFSNRLNTILVPEDFMKWSNSTFSSRPESAPSRLILDVSSPGDVRIKDYMKKHNYEIAGDKENSTAAYLINVITVVILVVGGVITLLSFFILLLTISLLIQKNARKMHSLIMLGVNLSDIAKPYIALVATVTGISYLLSLGAMFLFRALYLSKFEAMGVTPVAPWFALVIGLGLSVLITLFSIISIRSKVRASFYLT